MKPYYEQDGITIYHGDCRDIATSLEYDAVVSDPPYGMDYDTDGSRFTRGGRTLAQVRGDDAPFDPAPWIDRPAILWGFNHFPGSLPAGSALVWIKRSEAAFGAFLSDAEIAWWSKGCGVYAYRDIRHVIACPREHPTEKPVGLMAWCVGKVEGVVLDPFMGSGTTLRAAKDLGRKAIGIEIDERYCEIAAKRLAQKVLPMIMSTGERYDYIEPQPGLFERVYQEPS
jgi:DNA modification methylase